jgi:simple sugar transport system ATP-binding protein
MLEMRGIDKSYGAVRANQGIDLTVPAGRIVGLLGENGSGKSTLMKVLFGIVKADAGEIVFKGRPLVAHGPKDALAAGLGMIHQHFTLVEPMTVAENVMLGWSEAGFWLRPAAIAARIRQASATYGLDVDPDRRVEDLSFGARQRVEIAKAILRGADLLILDEPTSNLSPPEVEGLLGVLRQLRQMGKAVVFISHKLDEVLAVCDDIVVLRDGRVSAHCAAADATRAGLARMMVGRDVTTTLDRGQRVAVDAPEALAAWRLSLAGHGDAQLRDVSLSIRAGEILGIAGVDGNGQTELVEVLAGLRQAEAGKVTLNGTGITGLAARARMRAGIAYIPVDRAQTSLVPAMSVADNLALREFDAPPLSRAGWLDRAAIGKRAAERMAAFDIRAASPEKRARTLSGGNQQKIVLAREIGRSPSVLICHQPTWGLDPGATRFVIEQIVALRAAGAAVLYVSSSLEEILMLSDRVAVMHAGTLTQGFDRDGLDVTEIGLLMAGAGHDRAAA